METKQNTYTEDEIDLRELLKTIMDRKLFIIVFTSIITIGAIIWAFTRTPIYEVKSNIQIGFIGKNLIANPETLIKTANLVFHVGEKISTKKKFVSKVSSISTVKKLKNFVEIKTQAISNDEALKKNKEVVTYIKNRYKSKIDQFILSNSNNIKATEVKIKALKNLETKNLQQQIELLKTQKIVKIDEKIKFYGKIKMDTLVQKIKFYTDKLKEYTKSVNQLYKNSKDTKNTTILAISSLQMVNYQNLMLAAQNKIVDFKEEIKLINIETIPNLQREKKNIKNVTIRNLPFKMDNILNIKILNLQKETKNINNVATIRKLEYRLKVELPNKKVKLFEQIQRYKFQNSKQNVQNSKVIGGYIVKDYPVKPKKKLIIVVAFITGLILSIFIIFFLDFIRQDEDK